MTIVQKNLQSARLIHVAFLFAAAIYVAIPFLIAPVANSATMTIIAAFALIAFTTWAGGFFIRSRIVLPSAERLRENAEDDAAAARWRTGVVLSLTFCESVLLFGFALKILGASWNICAIFYGVGIFFLLAWRPRLELPPA
jgi:hypothetical protein